MTERSCEHCQKPVVRHGTRGRWPKLCPVCHASPEVQRERQRLLHERRVAAAEARVTNLMERLNATRVRSEEEA